MFDRLPMAAQAGFWGSVAGGALVLGAAIGYWARLPQRLIAAVMAYGSGVLISALAFDMMDEAWRRGGFAATAAGFVAGGLLFTLANFRLARHGAKHRKRSGAQQPAEHEHAGSGLAIALGALIDGIPESLVIGTSLLDHGGHVGLIAVAAIFVSNVPEGLSSAAGMRTAGRSPRYVFGLWTAIAVVLGVTALLGNLAFAHAAPEVLAASTAVAAGAILAMLADTMIPEAFEVAHDGTGLITVLGFLSAFALSRAGGG